MKFANIINWKEVTDQFGYPMAIRISKGLKEKLNKPGQDINHIDVPCSDQSEAIALFFLEKNENNQYYYEYRGTAN